MVQIDTSAKLVEELVQYIVDKNIFEEQHYNIAKGRQRRHIKAPVKYDYANLANFSLNVIENLDNHESCSYKEKIFLKRIF
jgi:tRNA U34 5-carboxymethylaminomethyl modifying enzyme MnmG/GidA